MTFLTAGGEGARAALVLAHGAGAGMRHAFMEGVATGLAERGIATLRYEFPYMAEGRSRPDPAAVCEATVRGAVDAAAREWPGLPLFAGGKSMGGRMTSQAAAKEPLPGVRGLVFLGFPLHAPRRPASARGDHLARVPHPMLFLQGTRDDLADLSLLGPIVEAVGDRAILHVVEGADHSFHELKRSGRTDADALTELLDVMAKWVVALVV